GKCIEVGSVFQKTTVNTKLPAPTAEQLLFIDQQARINAQNERFWMKQLSLVDTVIEPVQPSAIGPVTTLEIPVAGVDASEFNAALIFFLACYSNAASFSVGISNGKLCKMYDQSFGVFAEVLPFSLPPVADLTCGNTLAEIDRKLVGSFARGSYPFDLISRTPELKRKFSGTGNPVYAFILTNSADSAQSISKRYPGATIFIPGADRITIQSGDHSLLDDCSTRMSLFFQQLNAHRLDPVSAVNMLTLPELNIHQHLNDHWDLTGVKPFLQLFDNQVENHGEKMAIEFDNTLITYKELSHRSDQVAGLITTVIGRKNQQIIGICLDRHPDFLIVILGILKSGNVWLPLDPLMPAERLKAILLDSGVSHVFSTEKYRQMIPDSVMVLHAGNIPGREVEYPVSGNPVGGQNHAAYVIYTSGTSGKPKGVVIGSRSLDVFIHGTISRYALTSADRVLQFASLAFDASVEEIFPALACGATLVMRTSDSITGMNRFLDFCQDKNISVLNLPTAFWHQMMDYPVGLARVPDKLRLVIIGGERARNAQVRKWLLSLWNHITLVNTYGPTETTVVATAYHLPPGSDVEELPVGKSVFGAKARIRNVFGQPGIPSKPNELLIGGEIVSSGYLRRDELNKKSFMLISEGAEQIRYYQTGDLVTVQPDGNLMFAGRIDEQLKIRGFRVEVREIESAINQLPMVEGCVVVPVKQVNKDILLVAYVVLVRDFEPDNLGELLRSELPDYMIPAHFIGIPFVPLTINNKIDLKALPEPGRQEEVLFSHQQPETEMEKIVFSAWTKQLGIGNFGVDHDFFKLGGHSLMALAVMNEIETLTGRTIPLASLFSFPTVKTLAAALENEKELEAWRPLVCIKSGSGRIPLFIIHGGGLNVMLFNTLAQKMASDQTVYGIQAHGLDGKSAPYEHIDDIATHYMREIRSVLPNGPYALAGFSIGGLIAHELCCRFEELGEPVAFLGMFDTEAISNDGDLAGYQRKLLRMKETLLHIMFNLSMILTDPVNTIPKKFKWLKYRIRMRFLNQSAVNREDLVDLPSNLIYVAKANIKAISALKLRKFSGTLHLFRAGKRNFYVSDPVFLGWKKYAGEVAVYPIHGDHSMIFAPPNDAVFAEKLQKALDDVQRSASVDNLAQPYKM
ncbi:MAG: amino acid adenylation domain-containing protein, partial [Bacteroidota bacterium]